ncbi:PREDICTED: rho GTPase-activating protein 21-like, partial [Nicrophorus vespilloides]|uniref:Rho GTPase-activating protein 21-like n=1 Tax=Nicrophorus vespilloides TaxID=110193 RepID=A0ABM1M5A5_NICVS
FDLCCSGSLSGGSSSSVSLEREKITSCVLPVEKEKAYFVKEGLLHCKITEIDGKRFGDRSWKQVWAVLKGPKLFLYKDRHHLSPVGTSEVADQSLASGVDLRGSCVQVAGDYTKRKHVLRLSSVIPCRSELLLQAENPAHLAEWFQAFQEQSANSTEIEAKLNQIAGADKQRAMPQAIPATTSIQEPQTKSKLTSLRNRSPTGQSPVSKTRKPSQINDPSTSPKSKTWRGRFSKQLKRIHQSASSPNSPTAPEGSTFGNPLEHCLPSRYNSCVPRLVETCTEIVERKGLEIVGIYRVPGNSAAVTALTEEVNKCYDEVPQIDERWKDIHVVSSLLKSFFRKMPDPLVTSVGYTNFVEADKIEDPTSRVNEIRRLVKSLPPHNYNTLRHLIMHLKRVAEHSDSNKMEVKNLAIVFGPTIVRTCSNDMEAMVTDMTNQCKIVESLLTHADWFFADDEGEDLELPAPIATGEIFTNEPEINTALLKDNISKVGGHTKDHKMRKSWTSKYKRKNTKAETKTDASSPNGFKEFITHSNVDTRNSNKTDLKESTSEHKPNIIPTTVTEMEGGASRVSEASKDESRRRIGSFIQENLHDAPFNYKKGNEDFRRRVENFIQETQSQLQRPRKPETSSNNSLEMRTNPISSSASNVRLSLAVNPAGDQRTITKTHSASNVFSRPINVENGRNTIGGSTVQCFKPTYYYNLDDRDHTNSAKDSCSDVSSTSSDSRCKPSVRPSPFLIRRGSSENLNITSNGNLKKIKYESESDGGQKMGSSDSLNKLSADDGGDLLTSITKIFDEKISSSHKQSPLTMENIPFVDESPEKISRLPINAGSYVNKENIPGSPKTYRNPSLHKSQYSQIPKFLTSNYVSAKQKEKQEDKEKDEDSTMCLSVPDNERHLNKKVNILGSKLKRSESLNKPERTASPLSNKLKRSESLNKATEKLKRSDSLTKYEKTESNISKKREINSGLSRRTTKDFAKLKRKNGMPERSIKRRHTVGGTKDPDKVNLLDNRRQEELSDVNENTKEKNLRTSSPDLSSTRRDRYLFEVNLIGHENMVFAYQHLIRGRPQSFPESSVYKLPLESHV